VKDDVSTNQDDNLDYLIREHNERDRTRDVSVHFNHDGTTDGPRGVEVYYGSDRDWAADISAEIAIASGLVDRGSKDGTHLKWVRETEMPASLIEVAFVNAREDCERYRAHFQNICRAIAESIGDVVIGTTPPPIQRPPGPEEPPHEPHPPFPEWPDRPEDVPIEERPTLRQGDRGDDVLDMQRMIPQFSGTFDGDFGPVTYDNVVRYQRSRGLEADGICGPQTWEALYEHRLPVPPPPPPPGALAPEQVATIMRLANESAIAGYSWDDRGVAPTGFTQGIALSFAQTYKKLKAGHPAAVEMAKARTSSEKDVLNLWRDEFEDEGMYNEDAGIDVLRHLYAFMLGSGMRESSGQHCCGRDQSASNVESDTCEAGAFQTSYNASNASEPEFDNLMDEFLEGLHPGYLDAWSEGVSCSSSDWENYGSGKGKDFQRLCKEMPAFSAETHALTLRNLCNHYGPVIRFEVELKKDADRMFAAVQAYMDETEPAA
jgi:peptidoglycan hydrolase-like protein with peptidoglycan-binding domain